MDRFFIRFVVFGYGDVLEDPFELRVSHIDWSNRRLRFSSCVDDGVTNTLKKWESCYHFNKRDGDPTAPWAILYTKGTVKKRFKLFDLLPQGCFSFNMTRAGIPRALARGRNASNRIISQKPRDFP